MKTFVVKELEKKDNDKPDEFVTRYRAFLEEDVPEGNVPDKIRLTSDKPIELKKKDEVKLEKIAFQKTLKGKK